MFPPIPHKYLKRLKSNLHLSMLMPQDKVFTIQMVRQYEY